MAGKFPPKRPPVEAQTRARSIVERGWFWIGIFAATISTIAVLAWGAAVYANDIVREPEIVPIRTELQQHHEAIELLKQRAEEDHGNWLWLRCRLSGGKDCK